MTHPTLPATAEGPAHLLLLDGLNILRRCYEANPAPDSAEKAQAAARSALGSFRRALHEHRPSHALAAFDPGGRYWRHDVWADYRRGRKPMPQELRDELPAFKNELQTQLGLKTLTLDGVEADDVLAAAALRWLERPEPGAVTVVSTDKDLCALIAQGVRVRDHFTPAWRDAAWVERKFGVSPAQLQDCLALTGDAVDAIPGVPGIGPKTAAKLLLAHGTLEGVLAAAEELGGKVGESLRTQAHLARLSRQLVGFKQDIRLGLTWRELQMA